jgi:hypothetical protein
MNSAQSNTPSAEVKGASESTQAGAKFIRSNKRSKGIYLPETSHDTRVVTWDDL